ncbi:MAG TPA: nitroreductase [Ohtaekwangia sp.]|uniref:nitroreductase family protein n=1 Tax=Ohtaekwangia sp. TaxID=2066019 RepID=UPI002F93DB25
MKIDATKVELVNSLIRNRRSVYQQHYTGERVDDEIVTQMLENARWAPTHKLTEPWQFVVFTGEGLRKLGEAQATVYKKVTEADGTFKEERYQNLLTKTTLSSHIIAVGMKRDDKKSVPEVEEIGAVFCAVENMYLTAAAYGIGCYLSTGGITYFEAAKELFGLGDDDKLLGFLHIGIPKAAIPDSKRKPIEDKSVWVRG